MARFGILAAATVWLSTVAVSLAALPPKSPETAAAKAFRLAGFSASREVGCGWSVAVFKAGPNVGDAELKTLVDPGEQVVLDLSKSRVSDAGIKELAKFSKIYRLNLCGSAATLACLKELTKFKYLAVNLDPAQVTAESAQAITKDATSNHILTIDPINDAAFHVLSKAHLLHLLAGAAAKDYKRAESDEAIVTLSLISKDITDASMKDVASLQNLASFQLWKSAVTEVGMKELKGLHHLSRMDLSYTKVTDTALLEIAKLENLKSITLQKSAITGAGLKYLAHRAELCIELDEAAITPDNLQEISQAGIPSWTLATFFSDKSLHALQQAGMLHLLSGALARNGARPRSADDVFSFNADGGRRMTPAGYKELAVFKNIEKLDFQSTALNDADLASVTSFEHLTTMNLGDTQITDAGLKLLATQKNLTSLNVEGTGVTKAGVAELQLALPNCVIKH